MVEDQRFVPLLSVESAVDDAVDSEVCGGGVDAPPEEDDVTELMHKLCIIRKETDALVTDLMLSDVCELVAVLELGVLSGILIRGTDDGVPSIKIPHCENRGERRKRPTPQRQC